MLNLSGYSDVAIELFLWFSTYTLHAYLEWVQNMVYASGIQSV
jgi:hypothetical protein